MNIFLCALNIIVVLSLLTMAGHDILPAGDEVCVVKGAGHGVASRGAIETAKQQTSAGVGIVGITEKMRTHLSMNTVILIMVIAVVC